MWALILSIALENDAATTSFFKLTYQFIFKGCKACLFSQLLFAGDARSKRIDDFIFATVHNSSSGMSWGRFEQMIQAVRV